MKRGGNRSIYSKKTKNVPMEARGGLREENNWSLKVRHRRREEGLSGLVPVKNRMVENH